MKLISEKMTRRDLAEKLALKGVSLTNLKQMFVRP